MTFELCDGTTVEYEPKHEDMECDECGHVTGQRICNEPDFHGKITKRDDSYFCVRCEAEMGNMYKIGQIVLTKMIPAIADQVNQTNAFYRKMKEH